MGKNRTQGAEQTGTSKSEPTSLQKHTENTETERRLAGLEKAASDLNNRVFDGHKWFVTLIFSALAIVLGVYGLIFKSDVRESITQMERRALEARSDLEKKGIEIENKVLTLVGDALKKPLLQAVTEKDEPLEGKTNIVDRGLSGEFRIYTVYLKNVGEKRTEPIAVRYLLKAGFALDSFSSRDRNDWDQAPITQGDFGMGFYLRGQGIAIAPGQMVIAPQISLGGDLQQASPCELEVFYGGEKPLRTRFFIR